MMDRGEGSSRNAIDMHHTSEKGARYEAGHRRDRERKRRRKKTTEEGSKSKSASEPQSRRRTPSPELEMLYFVDFEPDEVDLDMRSRSLPPPRALLPGEDSDDDIVEISNPTVANGNEVTHANGATSKAQDMLLLPAHVKISETNGDANIEMSLDEDSDEDSFIAYMDYLDEDIQKGAVRYFNEPGDENSKRRTFVCKRCAAEGDHKTRDCPVVICLTCGARNEHATRGCPISKTCFNCGMKGHLNVNCPKRHSRGAVRDQYDDCGRCGSTLHQTKECPTLWRIYEYFTDEQQEAILQTRRDKMRLPFGAGGEGYIAEDEWCYNCGEEGHLGDDCQDSKRSSNFPDEPSAFGRNNTSSGPFADISVVKPRPYGQRPPEWEYDGLFNDEHGKDMLDVGRKGRDKEKARMRKQQNNEPDDEGDWFERNLQKAKGEGRSTRRRSPERERQYGHSSSNRDNSKPKARVEISIKGEAARSGLGIASLPAKPTEILVPSVSSKRRHRDRDRDRHEREMHYSEDFFSGLQDSHAAQTVNGRVGDGGVDQKPYDRARDRERDRDRNRGGSGRDRGRERRDEPRPNGYHRPASHHHHQAEKSRSQYHGGYSR